MKTVLSLTAGLVLMSQFASASQWVPVSANQIQANAKLVIAGLSDDVTCVTIVEGKVADELPVWVTQSMTEVMLAAQSGSRDSSGRLPRFNFTLKTGPDALGALSVHTVEATMSADMKKVVTIARTSETKLTTTSSVNVGDVDHHHFEQQTFTQTTLSSSTCKFF